MGLLFKPRVWFSDQTFREKSIFWQRKFYLAHVNAISRSSRVSFQLRRSRRRENRQTVYDQVERRTIKDLFLINRKTVLATFRDILVQEHQVFTSSHMQVERGDDHPIVIATAT